MGPSPDGYAAAAAVLREGGIVVYPTETVYGLGADPFNETAVRRLFEVKGRDDGKPVLLVVADKQQLEAVVSEVSRRALSCMEAFWPGPLSLLFPRNPALPDRVTAGSARVCVRCPGCAIARALCAAFGCALTSTSANLTGGAPATRFSAIDLPGVDLGIDGGDLATEAPSTIYDPEEDWVIRAGPISETALKVVISG